MGRKSDDVSRISHYRIAGELGRDRLGFVLRAVDEALDRPVALKVVRAAEAYPADDVAAVRERFKRNAQRAARLQHPVLVTLYAFQRIGAADVIAMELVEGETLKARLARGERWRALDAAALVARIADGVAAAHARQLVHGHLSVANVKVGPDGRPRVLDLGIPKASADELAAHASAGLQGDAPAPATDFQTDVAALARITCHLITGAFRRAVDGADLSPADAGEEPRFPDPGRVLANFGVLAPVLSRALNPSETERFADAGEFRDALIALVRRPAGGGAAAGPAKRGGHDEPARTALRRSGAPAMVLPLDAASELGPFEKLQSDALGPALVLPPDLAGRGAPPPPGAFVVMGEAGRFDRVRMAAEETAGRFGDFPWGRAIAAVVLLAVLGTGFVVARRLTVGGDASAAILGGDDPPAAAERTVEQPAPLASLAATDTAQADSALADSAAAQSDTATDVPPDSATRSAGVRTAAIEAAPAGTAITLPGVPGSRGYVDRAELSVPEGDSIVVRFVRSGYVPQTRVFRGEPLAVSLVPDSVTVRFDANVAADVFLVGSAGQARRLGTTAFTARLPTGVHRVLYRAANQDDWATTSEFPTPGHSYDVRKMDYATRGDLVATVVGAWAFASLDGGEPHETPYRFTDLPVGRHVLELTREGFQTLVDTVFVRGGEVLNRQYTLTPAR